MERFGRAARSESGEVSEGRKAADAKKQSLYFTGNILQEMKEEAARLDRSLSWVVQRAWKLAKADIAKIPSMGDADDAAPTSEPNDGTESDEA